MLRVSVADRKTLKIMQSVLRPSIAVASILLAVAGCSSDKKTSTGTADGSAATDGGITTGSQPYVACTPDNSVAVIDLKSLEVVGRIDAGGQPDGLAWAPRASR